MYYFDSKKPISFETFVYAELNGAQGELKKLKENLNTRRKRLISSILVPRCILKIILIDIYHVEHRETSNHGFNRTSTTIT